MLLSNERWVFIYDFVLEPYPDNAPYFDMKTVAKRLQSLFDADGAVKMYKNESVAMRVSDMRLDRSGERLTLLIQYADKNGSDPVFSNLESGALRVEPKLDGEGIAVSAHVVIHTMSTKNGGNQYLAVMEEVPGISKTTFRPFFTALLKDAFANAEFEDPDTGNTLKCRPLLEMDGHPGETLEESVEKGRIMGLTLIDRRLHQNFDEEGYTEAVDHQVRLKVVKQPETVNEKLGMIRNIFKSAKQQGYTKLKVTYKRPQGGRQSTIELDRLEDATDKCFTRQEMITLENDAQQCEQKIHKEIEKKMNAILTATMTRE